MTLTWQAPGTVSGGSTASLPGYPASVAAGELLLLFVAWGNPTDTPPATPTGFYAPPNNTYTGGAGAWGVDTGIRGVTVFCRIADGTESGNVTVNSGSLDASSVISTQIMRITKTAPAWYVTVVGGSDNSAGSGFSVTAGSDPKAVNGDILLAGVVWYPDTQGATTPTIVHTGTGGGATTAVQSIANASGNDQRFLVYRRASAGTSSAAPQFTATAGATTAGAVAFVLLHEGPPVKRYIGNRAALVRASTY